MKTKWTVRFLLAGFILPILLVPRRVESCGPYIPQAVFVRPNGPDRPMSSFAKGRLGVILPTWNRAYLVVAYRYLEKAIGMAYVPSGRAEPGTEFEVDVRGRRARARIIPLPFYKRPRG